MHQASKIAWRECACDKAMLPETCCCAMALDPRQFVSNESTRSQDCASEFRSRKECTSIAHNSSTALGPSQASRDREERRRSSHSVSRTSRASVHDQRRRKEAGWKRWHSVDGIARYARVDGMVELTDSPWCVHVGQNTQRANLTSNWLAGPGCTC